MFRSLLSFILFALLVIATPALRAQREKIPPEDLDFVEKTWPTAKKTSTGIRYIIQQPGVGEPPTAGDLISVLYVGRLLSGETFDQKIDREKPLTFRVGRDMVIQGWDQILQMMKKGERRLVIIPPELAYGTRGKPPTIPRNATLLFLVELLDIKKD
jgi:FKBP-type peptidyl-prolyl cis-trans isomerase